MEQLEITEKEKEYLLPTSNLISYIRGLLPDEYFTDKTPALGVYDALQQKYLKMLLFCVCLTIEGQMIEEYTFALSQSNSDVSTNINHTGTMKQGGTVKSFACKMIGTILHMMRTLDKMPEEVSQERDTMYNCLSGDSTASVGYDDILRQTSNLLSYIKELFPLAYFTDKNVPALDMKINQLMQTGIESSRLINLMEEGVQGALQKKYLKTLLMCVRETMEGPEIEKYAFALSHSNSDVWMNINRTGTKKQTPLFTVSSSKHHAWTKSPLKMEVGNFVLVLKVKSVLGPCEHENVDAGEDQGTAGTSLGLEAGAVDTPTPFPMMHPPRVFQFAIDEIHAAIQLYPGSDASPPQHLHIHTWDSIGVLYNEDPILIFGGRYEPVTSIQEYRVTMSDAWCDRHHVTDEFRASYHLHIAARDYRNLWPWHEKLQFFYLHGLHNELPEDLSSLQGIVVWEWGRHEFHLGEVFSEDQILQAMHFIFGADVIVDIPEAQEVVIEDHGEDEEELDEDFKQFLDGVIVSAPASPPEDQNGD